MGEMVDYVLNGDDCESCGEYLGEGDGFPRQCAGCSNEHEYNEYDDNTPSDDIMAEILKAANNEDNPARKLFPKTYRTLKRIIKQELKKVKNANT